MIQLTYMDSTHTNALIAKALHQDVSSMLKQFRKARILHQNETLKKMRNDLLTSMSKHGEAKLTCWESEVRIGEENLLIGWEEQVI
jgi:hypothetical protein